MRYEPSSNRKRGSELWLVLYGRYFCSAATGQVEVWVVPIVTVQVCQKVSVLDTLISSCATQKAAHNILLLCTVRAVELWRASFKSRSS